MAQLLAIAGGSLPRSSLTLPDILIAQGVHALSTLGAVRVRPTVACSCAAISACSCTLQCQERAHAIAQTVVDPPGDARALAFLAHARGQEGDAAKRFAALAESLQRAGDPAAVDLLLTEAATLWTHEPNPASERNSASERDRATDRDRDRASDGYRASERDPEHATDGYSATERDGEREGGGDGDRERVRASERDHTSDGEHEVDGRVRRRVPEKLGLLQADARRALGRYSQALALLEELAEPQAVLLRAEVLRLQGAGAQAEQLAQALLAAQPSPVAAIRRGCHALLARLYLDRGDADACRKHARLASEREDDAAGLRAIEVLALQELMNGELDNALARAEGGVTLAQKRGERSAEARLRAVVGSVQRARGQLTAAARQFARACDLASEQGEFHAAVSFRVNYATAQLDAGELGPALANLRKGASGLSRLGRERDTARVLANWLLAAQLLGDFDNALALAARLSESAKRGGDPWALAFGLLSCAEMLIERGDLQGAEAQMSDLPALAQLAPVDRATALARSAGVWANLARLDRASAPLERAGASLERGGAPLERGGASLERGGASLERGGASLERGGASLERGGASLERGGASLERGGASLERGGASLERGGPGLGSPTCTTR